MSESRNRLVKQFFRYGCDMAQQEVQPLVRRGVEFDNADLGKHVLCLRASLDYPRRQLAGVYARRQRRITYRGLLGGRRTGKGRIEWLIGEREPFQLPLLLHIL